MSRERDPLACEHYCGEFPGAGGVMLVNKISIYMIEDDIDNRSALDIPPGWHWWNAKEGDGVHNNGGGFEHSWQAFADALQWYPRMVEGEHYKTYVKLSGQWIVERQDRRKGRRYVTNAK